MSSSVKFAEFGPFRLFPSERRLVMEGQLVALGSRALDILILLVEHAGSVVTKQELIAKAWPGVAGGGKQPACSGRHPAQGSRRRARRQ